MSVSGSSINGPETLPVEAPGYGGGPGPLSGPGGPGGPALSGPGGPALSGPSGPGPQVNLKESTLVISNSSTCTLKLQSSGGPFQKKKNTNSSTYTVQFNKETTKTTTEVRNFYSVRHKSATRYYIHM